MTLSRGLGAYDDGTAEAPGAGTTPRDVRLALAGLFSRPGVLPGGATPLVAGTSGWAYSVGRKHFVTQLSQSDGMQLFSNDGTVTVGATGVGSTVPEKPAAGLSRIDIIWVRHPTNSENGDTTSQPVFGVASGTPASLPSAPSIPAGAIELGRNTMTGGSSTTSTASAGNAIEQTAQVVLPRTGKYRLARSTRPESATGAAGADEAAIFSSGAFVSPSGQVAVNAALRLEPTSGTPVNGLYLVRLRTSQTNFTAATQIAAWYVHMTQTARGTTVPATETPAAVPVGQSTTLYLTVQRVNATGVAASGSATVSADATITVYEDAA
jgi:hypothetical protein